MTVRSVSQLTPELALEVAGRDVVVFADASVDDRSVRVRRVVAAAGTGVMTHHGDPATILGLVPNVGELPDAAYVVSIPASDLDLGFELSAATEAAVGVAVELIAALVT